MADVKSDGKSEKTGGGNHEPWDPVKEVLARLKGVKPHKSKTGSWEALCPAHDDRHQSLGVAVGRDGNVLLSCRAGCTYKEVAAAIDLTEAALFTRDGKPSSSNSKPRIADIYSYYDEAGILLYEVCRLEPGLDGKAKTFRQRRPDGKGGFVWGRDGRPLVLFRLPELLAADPAETVFIPEGEKDVKTLVALGLVATTSPEGAGKWKPAFNEALRDRDVVVLPDNDDPGRKHAAAVVEQLRGVAASVKVVELPGLPDKGDVTDWVLAGGTKEQLLELAASDSACATASEVPPVFGGPPRAISADLFPVPPLPPAMLPASLRGWLEDIARRGSFPLEFPTAAALLSLAALVGRKIGIRPKRHDDWLVVPNLWGAIVGPPSVQKTPGAEEAMLPLKRLVAEAIEAHKTNLEEFRVASLVNKAKAKAAKDALDKAAKGDRARSAKSKVNVAEGVTEHAPDGADLEELARQALLSEGEKPPALKRYVVNDATVEKLGEILAQNPNGVLTFRDELTGFLRTLDREGHENDRGFYLEGWNGTGGYTYDRIGRGTLQIPYVCLSLFGTIQPGPLARYIRASLSNNDGLMPRFQVLLYPDPPAAWVNVDRYPDGAAKNSAYQVFKDLDALDPQALGVEVDADRNIPFLRFDTDAQALFDQWRADLENRLRAGADSPVIQCHLGKFRSLMPSLALLFHLVEMAGTGALPPVRQQAAELAAAWCDLLEAHCWRVYQAALDGDPEPAQRLAAHLKASLPNPFRARDVVRKGWAGLTDSRDVELALGVLEDRNWLKLREVAAGSAGGRPTVEYWIHPALRRTNGERAD
jgi:putative DNA primase/helicase